MQPRTFLVLGLAILLALGVSAASIPDASGEIHACHNEAGTVRIVEDPNGLHPSYGGVVDGSFRTPSNYGSEKIVQLR